MSINKNNEKCEICSKNDITCLLVRGIGKFPKYIEKLICNKCNKWINSFSSYGLDELDIVDTYELQNIHVNEAND